MQKIQIIKEKLLFKKIIKNSKNLANNFKTLRGK